MGRNKYIIPLAFIGMMFFTVGFATGINGYFVPFLESNLHLSSAQSYLVIAATGGLTVTLKKATLVTGPLNWGTTTLRAGELGFTAHVDVTTGKLFDVEYTDPA